MIDYFCLSSVITHVDNAGYIHTTCKYMFLSVMIDKSND